MRVKIIEKPIRFNKIQLMKHSILFVILGICFFVPINAAEEPEAETIFRILGTKEFDFEKISSFPLYEGKVSLDAEKILEQYEEAIFAEKCKNKNGQASEEDLDKISNEFAVKISEIKDARLKASIYLLIAKSEIFGDNHFFIERAYDYFIKNYDKNSPEMANIETYKGMMLCTYRKKNDEGILLLKMALETREKIFGKNSVEAAMSHVDIAMGYSLKMNNSHNVTAELENALTILKNGNATAKTYMPEIFRSLARCEVPNEKRIEYLKCSLKLGEQSDTDIFLKASGYYEIAEILKSEFSYEESNEYAMRALKLLQEKIVDLIKSGSGNIGLFQRVDPKSMYIRSVVEMYDKTLSMISTNCKDLGNDDESLSYEFKRLECRSKYGILNCSFRLELARKCMVLKKYDPAETLSKEALDNIDADEYDADANRKTAMTLLGRIAYRKKDFKKSIEYYNSALKIKCAFKPQIDDKLISDLLEETRLEMKK